VYHFGIAIDPKHRRAVRGSETVEFGGHKMEWKIAELLIKNAPELVTTDDLRRSVWSDGTRVYGVEESTFYTTVSNARSKLKELGVTIDNEKGLGYRLIELTCPSC
jgi:DNA-binding response OmpR family regulator